MNEWIRNNKDKIEFFVRILLTKQVLSAVTLLQTNSGFQLHCSTSIQNEIFNF